ncbi:MFS transporter [Brevibacterium jeotgali]|uniref:Sugar transporter n=1 Tax=Brevibacterium jeotgali TaxID=1262550 RepID=A0A2H1L3Q0_9MICO|nr:MFS transporter [Brevibacterium jeotgali]TWC01787.1 MHS family alpha-ketoglutarate permease-like MFS transporter [Brevibacterium jeotgali]SMY11532.1 Sugar transporter [Brevibacterium jeotgali]
MTTPAQTAVAATPEGSQLARIGRRRQRKSFIASIVGQLLEWYEWSAYAVFAPFIALALFNPDDAVSGLLATFGVFAIGFLFRPLGGIVFGRIADRRGRRFVLVTTMLMMAGASVAIGLLPTFESIGLAASLLLLLARIIQGFAHGGESATANSYVAEIAPARRRGLWGSAVFMTIFGGAFLAFVVGGVITGALSEPQVQAWGWRIPFLLGAVLAVVALWLRIGMVESQVFQEGADDEDTGADLVDSETGRSEAGRSETGSAGAPGSTAGDQTADPTAEAVVGLADRVAARDGLGADSFSADTLKPLSPALSIVLIFFLVSGVAASNYTWTSYVSTYAQTQEGMSPSGAYWALVAALLVGLASLPFWGAVSDRWGRKPVLYVFTVGTIVTVFPLMGFIDARPWTLFAATSVALFLLSAGAALLASVMAETFPTASRTAKIGFAYSMATAVFGGTTPYVNELAVSQGVPWASNLFIAFAAALALWAAWRLPERRGIDLTIVR